MSNDHIFKVGDDVTPTDGPRGNVIDIRESSAGTTIIGVVTTNGRIDFYDSRTIRPSEGSTEYPMKLGFI